jgi:hypothetical protein
MNLQAKCNELVQFSMPRFAFSSYLCTHCVRACSRSAIDASIMALAYSQPWQKIINQKQKYMEQLLSITPLEAIGLGLVAVGIFLFYRACWRNIKRSEQRNQ